MARGEGNRPWFPWYPGDFKRDTAVQACPLVARGLWREMLDLMHDGEPYGYLTAGGVPITPEQLGRIVGEPTAKVVRWLEMLETRKVFSRTPDGTIYSRRMVRDERNRHARGIHGAESLGHPNVPQPRPKDTLPPGPKDTGKDTLRASKGVSKGVSPQRQRAEAESRGQRAEGESAPPPALDDGAPGDTYEHFRQRASKLRGATVPLTARASEAGAAIDLCARYPDQATRYALIDAYLRSEHKPIRGSPPTLGQVCKWAGWLEGQPKALSDDEFAATLERWRKGVAGDAA